MWWGLLNGCDSGGGGGEETVITTRAGAGRPLTYTEMDTNWTSLQNNAGVDVRSYLPAGYVTDGSVNYTTYVRQAMADIIAAGGGTLVIPPNFTLGVDYAGDSKSIIEMRGSNISVVGYGPSSCIKNITETTNAPGVVGLYDRTAYDGTIFKNLEVRNLRIDCGRSTLTYYNGSYAQIAGIFFGSTNNTISGVTVENVWVHDSAGDCIYFGVGVKNAIVRGNHFWSYLRQGIDVTGGTGYVISDNIEEESSYFPYGTGIHGEPSSLFRIGTMVVTGNSARNSIAVSRCDDLIVVGNKALGQKTSDIDPLPAPYTAANPAFESYGNLYELISDNIFDASDTEDNYAVKVSFPKLGYKGLIKDNIVFAGTDSIGIGVYRSGAVLQVSGFTRVGTTVTATTATAIAGRIVSGWLCNIYGAAVTGYNGTYTITVTGTDTFTYTVPSDPGADDAGGGYVKDRYHTELGTTTDPDVNDYVEIDGNSITSTTGRGIYVYSIGNARVLDNRTKTTTVEGIKLEETLLPEVKDNSVTATSANPAVTVKNTSTHVGYLTTAYIYNNVVNTGGAHSIWIPGTSGKFSGNETNSVPIQVTDGGVVIKNSTAGANTVADGGTITHNLFATPTVFTATPTVSNEIISVTSMSNTTATLAIKKRADGTPGTSQTVYWRASIGD